MRYGADTWFILALSDRDPKSLEIIRECKEGKAQVVVPMVVYAESTKKFFQRGVGKEAVKMFWGSIESSEKIRIVALTKDIAEEAARISLTYNIPLIDACVAATTKLTACDILLSGDADYALLQKKKYLKVQSW